MHSPQLIVIYSHSAGQNVRVQELPEKGKTVWAQSWLCDRDGAKGTNVAVAAARLGTPTALVSRTGDDFWADMADRLLEGSGVNTDFLLRDPTLNTPTGVVFVDQNGDNSIVLSPDEQTIPASQIDEALCAFPDAIYVASGYELNMDAANYALREAWKKGYKTALNPSPVPGSKPDLSFVTILFVNEYEAAELLQLARAEVHESQAANAAALQKAYGCPQVVITLGEAGYVGMDGETAFSGPAIPVKTVDTSGAGDGFMGAVLSELISGKSLSEACAFANRFSSYAVQKEGTIPGYPTRNVIEHS